MFGSRFARARAIPVGGRGAYLLRGATKLEHTDTHAHTECGYNDNAIIGRRTD